MSPREGRVYRYHPTRPRYNIFLTRISALVNDKCLFRSALLWARKEVNYVVYEEVVKVDTGQN